MTNYCYKDFYQQFYTAIENELPTYFKKENLPQQVVEDAMEYSLMAGGKRLRGVLVLAFCHICGKDWKDGLPLACAVEMVHAYSLIHDDLPCMDDDDLRRGKPTCHIKFDEATALLAGDGLLTYSFQLIADAENISPEIKVAAVSCLARSIGSRGMIGGQIMDMAGEADGELTLDRLASTHNLKTAELINCAITLGCLVGGGDEQVFKIAKEYGDLLGLTFQIVDDILDETSTSEELGKPVGSDRENHKVTYATLLGVDKAKEKVEYLLEQTTKTINGTLLEHPFLTDIAIEMAKRTN